jgi:hypothetical protein
MAVCEDRNAACVGRLRRDVARRLTRSKLNWKEVKMYKAMIMAAALAAVATPAFATSATDLVCSIKDNTGNNLIYTFDGNSQNADGSVGGTMVETGFSKNGRDTFSPVGNRPIWVYEGNRVGGILLHSREAQGWRIGTGYLPAGDKFMVAANLFHGANIVGNGWCGRDMTASNGGSVTASNVGDQGL